MGAKLRSAISGIWSRWTARHDESPTLVVDHALRRHEEDAVVLPAFASERLTEVLDGDTQRVAESQHHVFSRER